MPNRNGKVLPVGTSTRMSAVYICDVYHVTADNNEMLIARKYYAKPGYAKAYRTSNEKAFKAWQDRYAAAMHVGGRGYGAVSYQINGVPVVNMRCDVYAITPNGFENL